MITATERALLGPFGVLARSLSETWNVRIEVTGGRCETDGEVIRIPFRSADLPAEHVRILHGMLDHEVAHVAEERRHAAAGHATPMALLKTCSSRELGLMLNVFEDIRVEKRYGDQYPGMAENFRAVNDHLLNKRAGGEDPWHTFGCEIIRQSLGCPSREGISAEVTAAVNLVQDEIAEASTSEWGEDSLELARRVIDKVKSAAIRAVEHAENTAHTDTHTRQAKQQGAQIRQQTTHRKSSGEPGKAGGTAAGECVCDWAVFEMDSVGVKDVRDVVRVEIEQQIDQLGQGERPYDVCPAAKANDSWTTVRLGDLDAYERLKGEVSGQISGLRSKFMNLLQARSVAYETTGHRRGNLDSARLARLVYGDTRVFSQETAGEVLDTAVSLLIDLSGSMASRESHSGLSRIRYAQRLAVALGETLNWAKVPFEILGFENSYVTSYQGRLLGMKPDGTLWGRFAPFRWKIFHSFGEQFPRTRGRLCRMDAGQDNADSEAVWEVALRLAKRPEKRKILMVLSDGEPCVSGDKDAQCRHLHEVIRNVTQAGIEVLGIGCASDSVVQFYCAKNGADCIVIRDLEQMTALVYKLLQQRLLSSRKRLC